MLPARYCTTLQVTVGVERSRPHPSLRRAGPGSVQGAVVTAGEITVRPALSP
ncbi:MAG: hypothetical protein AVDCRST_MAG49-4139 [uncultured Thermomicrobiales bacterium]|uniref:Uncharacterized protein n=1 Tax=uncultured Thermomicrobiales bacterium TaxID=1645740 RepID=A0A6J4VDJ1_9BACT|nr:MAG: hypothetical protein AVDCRST_MAG49-4139 [uncultured Thermomicrobiales bacterium]